MNIEEVLSIKDTGGTKQEGSLTAAQTTRPGFFLAQVSDLVPANSVDGPDKLVQALRPL